MDKPIDIPVDADYAMRRQTPEEKSKWENVEVPEYKVKLDLTEEQRDRLKKQVFLEFEALKDEREQLKLEKKWEERDAQYDGQLAPIQNIEFSIDVRESKIKVDSIVRALKEALLPEGGDIIDVSTRPDMGRKDGFEVAERQQQFIDFAMDEEIKPEMAIEKIAKSAAKKYVGIGKLCWAYNQQVRRREEHWEGKLTPVGMAPDGSPILDNEGLRNFLSMYPDAPKRYPAQVKALMEGKAVDIVVQYKETISNNPVLKYIKLEDFYVRNCCDYNVGLNNEHLIVERQQYSYWELKKLEEAGDFENVDALWTSEGITDGSDNHKTRVYDVLEMTTYFQADDKGDATKIKCWFSEEKKEFLGAIIYPYYSIDCDYIGFWLAFNDKGFYGDAESIMFDLRDTHIAQDSLISLMLHSIYIRNIITPIVKEGSEVEQMFLDKQFRNGRPLPVDELTDDVSRALGFVQYPPTDTNGGLVLLEKMKRIGSDVSRVSDLVSGGESELDPTAPAQKTIAMLQQSGVGIKDYIRTFLPSFNLFATNLLQLYYQMSTEDRAYRVRSKSKQVTGKDVFQSIRREDMVARTVVQSRAAAFAFDKVNEKREAMAAYQLIMGNPYTARQPMVQYKALKTFLSTFGGRWKNLVDDVLESPEEFEQRQMQVAMQAIQMLFKQAQQQAQTTGIAPDPRQVMAQAPEAITKAQALDFNPALAEENKQ